MNLTNIPISKTKMVVPKRKADLPTRERLLNEVRKYLDRRLITISAVFKNNNTRHRAVCC